jgi:hypothetical protein
LSNPSHAIRRKKGGAFSSEKIAAKFKNQIFTKNFSPFHFIFLRDGLSLFACSSDNSLSDSP